MSGSNRSALSIVVPVHNSRATLERCLAAIATQTLDGDEVIVVDDGSLEDERATAARFHARCLRLDRRIGPAGARNRGAAIASRPWLLFVDADVVLHADALARVRAHAENPAIDAVMGSYDDTPEAPTLVSRFKNLAHHYFHQQAAGTIASFWAACGSVRRDLFAAVGGFDEARFPEPSIEDVELGWRMADHGARIVLDPELQATHLKQWTLRALVRTDVRQRAIPWVRWSIARRRATRNLNTSRAQRAAAVVGLLWVLSGIGAPAVAFLRPFFAGLTAVALIVNWRLFLLFWRKGGASLAVAGFLLQQLYYLCALAGLLAGLLLYYRPGRRVDRRADPLKAL